MPSHEIIAESAPETFGGETYLITCSCGDSFQEGPGQDLTADQAKAAAQEKWKLHLHGA